MIEENYQALATKRINLVIEMNRLFVAYGSKAYKIVQHNYVNNLLNKGHQLFTLNFLALKGENRIDEISKLLMDIQADVYFIHHLGGFTKTQAITLDNMCDHLINLDTDLDSSVKEN